MIHVSPTPTRIVAESLECSVSKRWPGYGKPRNGLPRVSSTNPCWIVMRIWAPDTIQGPPGCTKTICPLTVTGSTPDKNETASPFVALGASTTQPPPACTTSLKTSATTAALLTPVCPSPGCVSSSTGPLASTVTNSVRSPPTNPFPAASAMAADWAITLWGRSSSRLGSTSRTVPASRVHRPPPDSGVNSRTTSSWAQHLMLPVTCTTSLKLRITSVPSSATPVEPGSG
mmetsp:Transcript_5341/g.11540  ORF Transcript_5341/g.11540 Transcript_5341/m.11540 type:complete len:230 (+) Transcript_5341:1425-2114(+)